MTVNTTNGPVEIGREPAHHQHPSHTLNTSETVYEELSEIVAIVPATGWHAEMADGSTAPLLVFALTDTGEMFGVVLGPDDRVDLTRDNVEKHDGFQRYTQEVNPPTKGKN